MGVVNGRVTSLTSNFYVSHDMTCEGLVINWFMGDSNINIMEYRKLSPKYLVHVKMEQHT